MTEHPVEPQILVLARDLMFTGRIGAEARAAHVNAKIVRDPQRLGEADVAGASRLIVDLDLTGALEAAAAWKGANPSREVVAFVAHTNSQAIGAARDAHFDHVLTRGQFVELLPRLLKRPQ